MSCSLTRNHRIHLTKSFSNWQNPMANRFSNCLGLVRLDSVWFWWSYTISFPIQSFPNCQRTGQCQSYTTIEKVHTSSIWSRKQMKRTYHFLLWSMTYICSMHTSRISFYVFTKHVYKTISLQYQNIQNSNQFDHNEWNNYISLHKLEWILHCH